MRKIEILSKLKLRKNNNKKFFEKNLLMTEKMHKIKKPKIGGGFVLSSRN